MSESQVENALSKGDEWIRLKSGFPMPADGQWVIVYTGNADSPHAFIARRVRGEREGRFWACDYEDEWLLAGSQVTHWRPMVSLPSDRPSSQNAERSGESR